MNNMQGEYKPDLATRIAIERSKRAQPALLSMASKVQEGANLRIERTPETKK